MRTFFQRSHYFWAFSRMAIIFLMVFSILEVLTSYRLEHLDEQLFTLFCFFYLAAMSYCSIPEWKRTEPIGFIRKFCGLFSLFLGIIIGAAILYFRSSDGIPTVLILGLFPVWLILFGIRDLKYFTIPEKD